MIDSVSDPRINKREDLFFDKVLITHAYMVHSLDDEALIQSSLLKAEDQPLCIFHVVNYLL